MKNAILALFSHKKERKCQNGIFFIKRYEKRRFGAFFIKLIHIMK
jgi:hypothetical protein